MNPTQIGNLFLALAGIQRTLSSILERTPEPHEHDFMYVGDTFYSCWCGKPSPLLCGVGIGPWVNDVRPTCQRPSQHEGECE